MDQSILITFRGKKIDVPVQTVDTIGDLRSRIVENESVGAEEGNATDGTTIEPSTLKLLYKGKVLQDDGLLVQDVFVVAVKSSGSTNKRNSHVFRVIATGGRTQKENETMDQTIQDGIQKSKSFVRDDITTEGRRKMAQRQALGRKMLKQAQTRQQQSSETTSPYGFGTIETLPNLPDETKARQILESLANDPGVKACMAKHKWFVGSLAEMYPEGKVGESEVCVMGLNRNKGQRIQLRIRTDDLKGFRKILSIREVLYHELSHNVHSEHDTKFFQLMRQIKKECLEMDWTNGSGITSMDTSEMDADSNVIGSVNLMGGVYRLGGDEDTKHENETLTARELSRNAALNRFQATENKPTRKIPPEITFHCSQGQFCRTCGIYHDTSSSIDNDKSNIDGEQMDET